MIPRERKPGVVVLVDEDEAWLELFFGVNPEEERRSGPIAIYPGNDLLCTVSDLASPRDPPAPAPKP